MRLLDWDGHADGCHTYGQWLAWQEWPGTLHATLQAWRRVHARIAQRKRALRRARAAGRQKQVQISLVQAGLREGCESSLH